MSENEDIIQANESGNNDEGSINEGMEENAVSAQSEMPQADQSELGGEDDSQDGLTNYLELLSAEADETLDHVPEEGENESNHSESTFEEKSTEREDTEAEEEQDDGDADADIAGEEVPSESFNPLTPDQVARRRRIRDERMMANLSEQRDRKRMEALSAWRVLQEARSRGTILSGKITGGKLVAGRFFAVVQYDSHYKVLIEFKDFYAENPIRINAEESGPETAGSIVRRQQAMIEKLYGAPTIFVVQNLRRDQEENYVIIGSRAKAIQRRAYENFTPADNGEAYIAEGDFVPATIMSIAAHSIAVNVGGIDTRIPVWELTFRYVPTIRELSELFHVGQEILVQVRSVSKSPNGVFHCVVSHRAVEREEAKLRHEVFSTPGDVSYAVVTNLVRAKDSGRFSVLLYLEEFDLPAYATNVPTNATGRFPLPGDRVRVSFLRYQENSGMTQVSIRGIHGTKKN